LNYYRDPHGWPERAIELILGSAVLTLMLILFGRWMVGL
jgi:hypothetical protein